MDKLIKKITLGLLMFVSLLGISCKSVPKKINNQGFLTAMIVDENNKPVEGYAVKLCVDGISKSIEETKSSGLVYLPFINGKKIGFYGSKEGFTKIQSDELKKIDSTKVFCWKVCSEAYVLNEVEKSINNKDFKKAYDLLSSLNPSDTKEIKDFYNKLKQILGKLN